MLAQVSTTSSQSLVCTAAFLGRKCLIWGLVCCEVLYRSAACLLYVRVYVTHKFEAKKRRGGGTKHGDGRCLCVGGEAFVRCLMLGKLTRRRRVSCAGLGGGVVCAAAAAAWSRVVRRASSRRFKGESERAVYVGTIVRTVIMQQYLHLVPLILCVCSRSRSKGTSLGRRRREMERREII